MVRSIGNPGNKKGPVRSLFSAHGWLSPDGYTILPMRPLTMTNAVFMRGG